MARDNGITTLWHNEEGITVGINVHEKKQKYSQQVAEKKMKKHKISNYTNVSSFYNYHKFTNKSAFLKVTYVKIVVIDAELKKCKHIFNTFLLLATRYNRLPGAGGLVVAVCPESHLPPFSDAVTFCPSYSITYKKINQKNQIFIYCANVHLYYKKGTHLHLQSTWSGMFWSEKQVWLCQSWWRSDSRLFLRWAQQHSPSGR